MAHNFLVKRANLSMDEIVHYAYQFANEYDREYGSAGFSRSFLPENQLLSILQDKALNSIQNCDKDDAMRVAVAATKILATMGITLTRTAGAVTFEKIDNPAAVRERELAKGDESSYDVPPGDVEVKMMLNGKHIGSIEYIKLDAAPEASLQITGSWVEPKYQGKGYGRQMYQELFRIAKADGFIYVISDETLSDDAHGLWDSLVRNGMAQQEGGAYFVKVAVAEEFRQMNEPVNALDVQRDVGDDEKLTGEMLPANLPTLHEPDKNYWHPFGYGFGTEPESTRYGSKQAHEEMPHPDTGSYDEADEEARRKVAEVESNYSESGDTFDPAGDYLCAQCSLSDHKGNCGTVSGTISDDNGTCKWWQKDSPLIQIDPKFSQVDAGYTERPNSKGFGCHRCAYGAGAKQPDSKGRKSWCGFWGMHVLPNACCSKNEGDDDIFAPGEPKQKKESKFHSPLLKKAGQWGLRSYDSDAVHDVLDQYRPGPTAIGFDEPIPEEDVSPLLSNIHEDVMRDPEFGPTYLGVVVFLITHGSEVPHPYRGMALDIAEHLIDDPDYMMTWDDVVGREKELKREIALLKAKVARNLPGTEAIPFHDRPDFLPPRDDMKRHIDKDELDPDVISPKKKRLEGPEPSTGKVPLRLERAERTILGKKATDEDSYWLEFIEEKEAKAKELFSESAEMQQIAQDNGWTMEQAWEELGGDFTSELYDPRNRQLASKSATMDANLPVAEAYNQLGAIHSNICYFAEGEHQRLMSDALQKKVEELKAQSAYILNHWEELEGQHRTPADHAYKEPLREDQ